MSWGPGPGLVNLATGTWEGRAKRLDAEKILSWDAAKFNAGIKVPQLLAVVRDLYSGSYSALMAAGDEIQPGVMDKLDGFLFNFDPEKGAWGHYPAQAPEVPVGHVVLLHVAGPFYEPRKPTTTPLPLFTPLSLPPPVLPVKTRDGNPDLDPICGLRQPSWPIWTFE